MLASTPTPQRISVADGALDVRRGEGVATGGQRVLVVVEHPDVVAVLEENAALGHLVVGQLADGVDERRDRAVAGAAQ